MKAHACRDVGLVEDRSSVQGNGKHIWSPAITVKPETHYVRVILLDSNRLGDRSSHVHSTRFQSIAATTSC